MISMFWISLNCLLLFFWVLSLNSSLLLQVTQAIVDNFVMFVLPPRPSHTGQLHRRQCHLRHPQNLCCILDGCRKHIRECSMIFTRALYSMISMFWISLNCLLLFFWVLSLNSSLLLQVTQAIVDNFVMIFFSYHPGSARKGHCTEANAISTIHRIFAVFWMFGKNISENVPGYLQEHSPQWSQCFEFLWTVFFPGNSLNSFLSVASSPRYYHRQIWHDFFSYNPGSVIQIFRILALFSVVSHNSCNMKDLCLHMFDSQWKKHHFWCLWRPKVKRPFEQLNLANLQDINGQMMMLGFCKKIYARVCLLPVYNNRSCMSSLSISVAWST